MDNLQVLKSGFSSQYTPIQNIEAFDFLETLANDHTVYKMGSLRGGKRVYATIDIDRAEVLEKDQIINRLSFFNSFDGSSTLRMVKSIERVVCKNGMTHIENEQRFSIPHSTNAREKFKVIMSAIKSSSYTFENAVKVFKVMAETPLTGDQAFRYIANYLELWDKEGRSKTIADKKLNYIYNGFLAPDNVGTDFLPFRTIWDLYNAFTRYTTHYEKNEEKTESKLIGNLYKENETILSGMVDNFNL
jgi:hypothetical protein